MHDHLSDTNRACMLAYVCASVADNTTTTLFTHLHTQLRSLQARSTITNNNLSTVPLVCVIAYKQASSLSTLRKNPAQIIVDEVPAQSLLSRSDQRSLHLSTHLTNTAEIIAYEVHNHKVLCPVFLATCQRCRCCCICNRVIL